MITNEQKDLILTNMTEMIELPELAYQKAKDRYEDIGEWLGREESLCKDHQPHIFPQGSFRIGTAIRPLDKKEVYDLDMACKMQKGITKDSYTQEAFKRLVGAEIEAYRLARGIKAPMEEQHRCWRLEYQDDMSFHMDIVPCIPADDSRRKRILESMIKAGESQFISDPISQLTVSITDNRHRLYRQICADWNVSNPEGYAKWFEARMNQIRQMILEKAQVDSIPLFRRKTPLQRSIQILKRHRDQMFRDDTDVKPISVIITTLSAKAYQGETNIESSLHNILSYMSVFASSGSSVIPNPVNPEENFAERWSMPQYRHLNLKENFKSWVIQAQNDFALLLSSENMSFVTEQALLKYSVRMDSSDLRKRLGLSQSSISMMTPKSHMIKEPAKPWKD